MTLDLDHLRAWVGREELASERISGTLVARFNATFDRTTGLGEELAPRMLHWCLGAAAAQTLDLGPDGHPARGNFLPPVPLPRRMWAGGRLRFQNEPRIGDTLTRRSAIREVTAKEGRSGPLCFVKVEHQILAGDRRLLIEDQDIVYRAAEERKRPEQATPRVGIPAPDGAHSRLVTPTSALLFRYSALTFNGHRIHYDLPYARDVEGYLGLVVHGPLQATLLAQFAEEIHGRPPLDFAFRSLSPLFDDADFLLNATADGAGLKLWTSRVGGPVAMEAQATW